MCCVCRTHPPRVIHRKSRMCNIWIMNIFLYTYGDILYAACTLWGWLLCCVFGWVWRWARLSEVYIHVSRLRFHSLAKDSHLHGNPTSNPPRSFAVGANATKIACGACHSITFTTHLTTTHVCKLYLHTCYMQYQSERLNILRSDDTHCELYLVHAQLKSHIFVRHCHKDESSVPCVGLCTFHKCN